MSPTSYKLPVGGYYNNYRQVIAEEGGCFFIIFFCFYALIFNFGEF